MNDQVVASYWELHGFAQLYLEDSYVLGIEELPDGIKFEMELVLREGHPRYHPPFPDEQYCYERATILFDRVSAADWSVRSIESARAVDANGDVDYGNIDTMELVDGHYHLTGAWGEVRIHSAAPTIVYAEPTR